MNHRLKSLILLVVCLGGAIVSEDVFTPTGEAQGYIAKPNSDRPSSEAVSHALGEFRIVAANLIWLNIIDKYHHQFMEQGGDWSKNAAVLPYTRMITWLDPHFTEAYDVGGAILIELGRYKDARSFLSEGTSNNPTTWQLPYDLAMMHAWNLKDPKSALPYAEQAQVAASDPFDKQRVSLFVATLKDQIKTGRRVG